MGVRARGACSSLMLAGRLPQPAGALQAPACGRRRRRDPGQRRCGTRRAPTPPRAQPDACGSGWRCEDCARAPPPVSPTRGPPGGGEGRESHCAASSVAVHTARRWSAMQRLPQLFVVQHSETSGLPRGAQVRPPSWRCWRRSTPCTRARRALRVSAWCATAGPPSPLPLLRHRVTARACLGR